MKPSFRTIRPLPPPVLPREIYDPSVRPFAPKIELRAKPYGEKIMAEYGIAGHEIVAMPTEDSAAYLMRTRIEYLHRQLAMKKEAVLENFLCSGAMPWDISTEEGRTHVHTHTPVESNGLFLVVDQQWRVK